jgi:UDP-glucose 4-epimerase
MQDKRALVTGVPDFIGSNLSNRLAADNDVIALDDCYLGTPENLDENIRFVEKSVLDENLPTDIDVVFHLAALPSYVMHEDDP